MVLITAVKGILLPLAYHKMVTITIVKNIYSSPNLQQNGIIYQRRIVPLVYCTITFIATVDVIIVPLAYTAM